MGAHHCRCGTTTFALCVEVMRVLVLAWRALASSSAAFAEDSMIYMGATSAHVLRSADGSKSGRLNAPRSPTHRCAQGTSERMRGLLRLRRRLIASSSPKAVRRGLDVCAIGGVVTKGCVGRVASVGAFRRSMFSYISQDRQHFSGKPSVFKDSAKSIAPLPGASLDGAQRHCHWCARIVRPSPGGLRLVGGRGSLVRVEGFPSAAHFVLQLWHTSHLLDLVRPPRSTHPPPNEALQQHAHACKTHISN